MAENKPDVKTTDSLPASVSAEHKKRIHEKLKGLVEQELAHESETLGTSPAKPAVHGSIEWSKAAER
ncbi:MAG: hypothetical protein ACRD2B_08080 [Terriglobia bacterium]